MESGFLRAVRFGPADRKTLQVGHSSHATRCAFLMAWRVAPDAGGAAIAGERCRVVGQTFAVAMGVIHKLFKQVGVGHVLRAVDVLYRPFVECLRPGMRRFEMFHRLRVGRGLAHPVTDVRPGRQAIRD